MSQTRKELNSLELIELSKHTRPEFNIDELRSKLKKFQEVYLRLMELLKLEPNTELKSHLEALDKEDDVKKAIIFLKDSFKDDTNYLESSSDVVMNYRMIVGVFVALTAFMLFMLAVTIFPQIIGGNAIVSIGNIIGASLYSVICLGATVICMVNLPERSYSKFNSMFNELKNIEVFEQNPQHTQKQMI